MDLGPRPPVKNYHYEAAYQCRRLGRWSGTIQDVINASVTLLIKCHAGQVLHIKVIPTV